MHEISLSAELAIIVTQVAADEELTRITRINLQFGEMIQVVPDIFRFAFQEAVRGTLAENAEVDIEIMPVTLRCARCQNEFLVPDMVFRCINCRSTEFDIIHGKEMFVKSLEGEK
jgi:hydrogenase nickel incorporation protein HypA/HybF